MPGIRSAVVNCCVVVGPACAVVVLRGRGFGFLPVGPVKNEKQKTKLKQQLSRRTFTESNKKLTAFHVEHKRPVLLGSDATAVLARVRRCHLRHAHKHRTSSRGGSDELDTVSAIGHFGPVWLNPCCGLEARLPAEEALLAADGSEVALDHDVSAWFHRQRHLFKLTPGQHRCWKQEAPATGSSLRWDSGCGLQPERDLRKKR